MKRREYIVDVICILVLVLCALSSRSDAKEKPAAEYPTDVRIEADVAYLPENRHEKADLYFPKEIPAGTRLPAVIVIHGGGFNDGDKARKREIETCHELALHGYAAMSINYRLWFKEAKNPTWPQCLYDAKTAVRWLRKHADRLQIDPQSIAALGYSAGGNLATMLAVTKPSDGLDPAEPYGDVSAAVKCAVDIYGAVNLPEYHDMKMFLRSRDEAPDEYRRASPVSYIDKDDPPILIIHGDADEVVNISQSKVLDAKLQEAGVEHHFVTIAGAPHSFDLQLPQRDLRPLVFQFLDKRLKSPGANP